MTRQDDLDFNPSCIAMVEPVPGYVDIGDHRGGELFNIKGRMTNDVGSNRYLNQIAEGEYCRLNKCIWRLVRCLSFFDVYYENAEQAFISPYHG